MKVNTTSAGRRAERPKARRMLVLRHDTTSPQPVMCEINRLAAETFQQIWPERKVWTPSAKCAEVHASVS